MSEKTWHIQQILDSLQPDSHSEYSHRESTEVLFKLATHWKALVGNDMSRLSSPLSFQKGILVVGISDPTLIFQCNQSTDVWKEKLNDCLGPNKVNKVEFKLL